MPQNKTDTAAALAAFLAKGGKVTRCPSADAAAVADAARRAYRADREFEATGLTTAERDAIYTETSMRIGEGAHPTDAARIATSDVLNTRRGG